MGTARFDGAVLESLHLLRWYAREHVLLCLIPAFFIAGAITVFVSQASVMKYLGAGANKVVAYAVASVSGTVLAVCSCTVLPLFARIYKRGAGLGPATAFLYSGPAINVLAIVLTARVLGWRLGVARALGAVAFSVVIGLVMHALFRAGERVRWAEPDAPWGFWFLVFDHKWLLTAALGIGLAIVLVRWFALPAASMTDPVYPPDLGAPLNPPRVSTSRRRPPRRAAARLLRALPPRRRPHSTTAR